MSNPGALGKREALRAVPLAARKSWAAGQGYSCPQCCARVGGAADCPYPAHWSGGHLDAAYAALVTAGAAHQDQEYDRIREETAETADDQAEREMAADAEAANNADEDGETGVTACDPVAVKVTKADRDAAATIAGALRELIASTAVKPDLSQVKAMIDAAEKRITAAIPDATPRALSVQVNDLPAVTIDTPHERFPLLLKVGAVALANNRAGRAPINIWLAGPAGSGKTTAAELLAKSLGLPYRFTGAVDSEYKLAGFVDANGRIINTAFRSAYTDGGLFLFDEVDVSSPSAVLAFNAALGNGHADFPGTDLPTPRNRNFLCVAGANTIGLGANVEYVGRTKLDAAFLDRFSFMTWGYDETLERTLAGARVKARPSIPERTVSGSIDEWVDHVQTLRKRAAERGLRVIISPRASIRGAAFLAGGIPFADVVDLEIKNRMSAADYAALTR